MEAHKLNNLVKSKHDQLIRSNFHHDQLVFGRKGVVGDEGRLEISSIGVWRNVATCYMFSTRI